MLQQNSRVKDKIVELNILLILPDQKKSLSLHYNTNNSFFYANGVKIHQFIEKNKK